MEGLLSPANLDQRRASLQPSYNSLSPPTTDRRASLQASLSPPLDQFRRSTCPSDQLRDAQKEFFNKRVHSYHEDEVGCMGRLQKSASFIETVNSFFKVKPWNSEENLDPEIQKSSSQNSSNTSLNTSLKTVSPLMTRKDLEQFDFIIPKSPGLQKQISIHKDSPSLGKIDVTQYLTNEEAQELQEVGTQLRLGEAKFCIVYNADEAKLKFILKSVSVLLKPSASVVGCNWVCETTTFIEMLHDKKHKPTEISYGQEHLIDIKNDDVSSKTIRLTVYDNRRKHAKNPIGHVLFPLRDVPNLNKMNIHSKKLTCYSQPAGFNKGNLSISLSWAVSAQRLEVKVGKGSNLKHEYGVDGKEFYIKMTVFILENKYKVFKTALVRATPDVNFREKFTLPLTSPQLKDSTLTFHLYMKPSSKKRLTKVLTGKTVIGPYMRHSDRTLSQWEKMITTPMEEIMENHILYL